MVAHDAPTWNPGPCCISCRQIVISVLCASSLIRNKFLYPDHSTLHAIPQFFFGIICGPKWGSFAVRDHLRSNMGLFAVLVSFAVQFGDHLRFWDHLRSWDHLRTRTTHFELPSTTLDATVENACSVICSLTVT